MSVEFDGNEIMKTGRRLLGVYVFLISEESVKSLFFGDLTIVSAVDALRCEEETLAYEDGTKAGILTNLRSRVG